jgi:hypothetical protein
MIYGMISILLVSVGLILALAFMLTRVYSLVDGLKRDQSAQNMAVRDCTTIAQGARDAWSTMETTHYTKLASRFSALEGLVEGLSEKQKVQSSSVDQLHQKFSSWSRTEKKPNEKNVERAPEVSTLEVSENATLQRLIDEGIAVPLSTSNHKPPAGRSLRFANQRG